MIEQEMVIMKASDLEEYKAKHAAGAPTPIVQFFSAHVPEDAYDKEKAATVHRENVRLRNENKLLQDQIEELKGERNYFKELLDSSTNKLQDKAERRFKEYEDRIKDLEKALVEATLKAINK